MTSLLSLSGHGRQFRPFCPSVLSNTHEFFLPILSFFSPFSLLFLHIISTSTEDPNFYFSSFVRHVGEVCLMILTPLGIDALFPDLPE